jgi:uncharacterized protein (TIGR00299 family) protein
VSRLVYFDCASGASGDMILGALVDMGLPVDTLRAELGKLRIGGFRLEARRVHRAGLHATKVDVVIEHGPDHAPEAAHGHRRLGEILDVVERSSLAPELKDRASGLFRRLAEAEAAVHGTSTEEVQFHEVGALDSIVDVVGAVIGLAWLKADRYVASPLNVGSGSVRMAHGTFSVPPPATARLVKGAPVYGAGEGELLTPTGALLVTGYATSYGPLPPLRLDHVGHGAGSRETGERPNVMRLVVGEEGEAGSDRVLVVEAEVDDMTPQLFGPLIDRLLDAGALDAYLTPIQMKKGRPGVLITAVIPTDRRESVEDLLFAETTTLGVRRQLWDRTVLEREAVRVETAYGPIGVKVGRRAGRVVNAQPEFEDCVRAAKAAGVPIKEAWAAALAAFRSRP